MKPRPLPRPARRHPLHGCATPRYGDVTAPFFRAPGPSHYSKSNYTAPGADSGVGPITQSASDATSAATVEKGNQDIRDAAAAASAASAGQ